MRLHLGYNVDDEPSWNEEPDADARRSRKREDEVGWRLERASQDIKAEQATAESGEWFAMRIRMLWGFSYR